MKEYQVFEKYKLVIINEIIREFGIEYEEYIRLMFNNLKIIFETTPKEEYLNIKYSSCRYGLLDKLRKYKEYIKLEDTKKKIFMKEIKASFEEWISCFVDLNDNKNYDKIIHLFSSYRISDILIDYFSSEWNKKLTNGCLDKSLLEYINYRRNKFISIINENGYKIKNLDSKIVDVFIKIRDYFVERKMIEQLLLEDNSYISRISKIINVSDIEIISDILKKENPTCFKYVRKNGQDIKFVYVPISRLKRYGNKTIDVILIHELIHFLQQYTDKEVILNEVLVQYKAIRITEKLHKKGIFIFDDEENAKVGRECIYEALFPFIQIILENVSSEIINKCILDDNYWKLSEIFGGTIYKYIEVLDKLFKDVFNDLPFNCETILEYDECVSQMTKSCLNNNITNKKRILNK